MISVRYLRDESKTNDETLPIESFNPCSMMKIANTSCEETTMIFDVGEIALLPESVIELSINRIKKLKSIKNRTTFCSKKVGADADEVINQEHTFEMSKNIIKELKAGKSFKGMLKIENLFIMPKPRREPIVRGPDAGFFNYLDANYHPNFCCHEVGESEEDDSQAITQFMELMF